MSMLTPVEIGQRLVSSCEFESTGPWVGREPNLVQEPANDWSQSTRGESTKVCSSSYCIARWCNPDIRAADTAEYSD